MGATVIEHRCDFGFTCCDTANGAVNIPMRQKEFQVESYSFKTALYPLFQMAGKVYLLVAELFYDELFGIASMFKKKEGCSAYPKKEEKNNHKKKVLLIFINHI